MGGKKGNMRVFAAFFLGIQAPWDQAIPPGTKILLKLYHMYLVMELNIGEKIEKGSKTELILQKPVLLLI